MIELGRGLFRVGQLHRDEHALREAWPVLEEALAHLVPHLVDDVGHVHGRRIFGAARHIRRHLRHLVVLQREVAGLHGQTGRQRLERWG